MKINKFTGWIKYSDAVDDRRAEVLPKRGKPNKRLTFQNSEGFVERYPKYCDIIHPYENWDVQEGLSVRKIEKEVKLFCNHNEKTVTIQVDEVFQMTGVRTIFGFIKGTKDRVIVEINISDGDLSVDEIMMNCSFSDITWD